MLLLLVVVVVAVVVLVVVVVVVVVVLVVVVVVPIRAIRAVEGLLLLKAHPFTRTRSALHTCQANGKNTRSHAPAQHCTPASQMVRTPVHAHPLSTAHISAK